MAKFRNCSLSIANIGDSCYLLDHHNRRGEALLYLTIGDGDSVAEIVESIRDEYEGAERIPMRVKLDQTELQAVALELLQEMESAAMDECDSIDCQLLVTW